MTAWPAGLVTIILVTVGTTAADRTSVKLCPCTQGCCDENWFQYKDACYRPVKFPHSWREAEELCTTQNAHLASIHTPEEDQFVFYLMEQLGSYWLGAQKIRREGDDSHWKWTDESPWQYASVKLRSKSDRFKNCVMVKRSDDENGHVSWNYERACDRKNVFVCKYLLV